LATKKVTKLGFKNLDQMLQEKKVAGPKSP
jgi:hypothetical protein